MKTAFIVPVLNSSVTLDQFLEELESSLWSSKTAIIFIDNGSTDSSVNLIDSWSKQSRFEDIEILQNGANLGYGYSVKRGVNVAFRQYEVVNAFVLHSDIQFRINELYSIYTQATERCKAPKSLLYVQRRFVIFERATSTQISRLVGNLMLGLVSFILIGQRSLDMNSPFLMITKNIFKEYFEEDQLTSGIFLHPQLNLLVLSQRGKEKVLIESIEWRKAPKTVRRPLGSMGFTLLKFILRLTIYKVVQPKLSRKNIEHLNKILKRNEKEKFL